MKKEIRFTVRLTEELDNKLQKIADKTGYTKNTLIINACWNLLGIKDEIDKTKKLIL